MYLARSHNLANGTAPPLTAMSHTLRKLVHAPCDEQINGGSGDL
jgi:hypothetical protein